MFSFTRVYLLGNLEWDSKTAGFDITVVQQNTLLEIRNVNKWTSSDYIVEQQLRNADLGEYKLNMIIFKKAFDGMQMESVMLTHYTKIIVEGNFIKIGIVSCKIRLRE